MGRTIGGGGGIVETACATLGEPGATVSPWPLGSAVRYGPSMGGSAIYAPTRSIQAHRLGSSARIPDRPLSAISVSIARGSRSSPR